MRHQDASEVMNKDVISHFVLRLVYCRTYVSCYCLFSPLWNIALNWF